MALSGIATPTRIAAEPAAVDDNRLVAAVRRGDDRAFEALYSRYCRRIHAYVMGMVKDHGRAEDITQEVFVSALRRMRDTERPIAFKPWVYEIAKNACIDQFRRSRRAEEISLQADGGLAPADYGRLVGSDPAPEEAVAAKLELDTLCGAFGGLSDTHHEILVLRELEGLSYREIGDRMGISRSAVESTLFRARRRLNVEYDELVTGARCTRIQSLIATAATGSIGARAERRLSRHVAYCQPCRREALAAGLDSAILTRPPLRKRAAAKVAALLPFPVSGRWRGGGSDDAMAGLTTAGGSPLLSDQLAAGWGKLATVAAVLIAGLGATEVGTRVAGHHDTAAPERAASQGAAATTGAKRTPARVSMAGAPSRTSTASKRTQRRGTARRGARHHARSSGSGASTTSSPTTAAAGSGGGGGGSGSPAGPSVAGVTGSGAPAAPAVKIPASGQDPTAPAKHAADQVVTPIVNQAKPIVDEATGAVQGATNTVNQAGQTAQDTTGVPVPPLP